MKYLNSKNAIIFILLIFIWYAFNIERWQKLAVLNWDISAYNLYNTALLIHGDVGNLDFYKNIDNNYAPTANAKWYGLITDSVTNKTCNRYPCGVAIFQAPFFYVAHIYTTYFSKLAPDGFSMHYQKSVALSTILFSILGLLVLRKFLLNYFTDKVVLLTLLIIAFATNFFNYAALEFGMAHIYLFFIYACVLQLTYLWYLNQKPKHLILLAFCIGLATITRPTDFLIILIPLFWNLKSLRKIALENKYFYVQILKAAITFALVVFVQMAYWKYTTNNWLFYSYTDYGFNFSKPQIIKGLFSYRRGWFVYSPILLLSVVGFYFVRRNPKTAFYFWPCLIFMLPTIYILFSWFMWFYGGGFGCRALLQSVALMALPLASFLEYVFNKGAILHKATLLIVIAFCIFLNIFQTYQFKGGILHYGAMTKAYYWKYFLTLRRPTIEDEKILYYPIE